jgi:lycopene beta-cyclase
VTRVAILGGGLSGGLLALALRRRPDVEVRLLERSDRLGGNHTWSFHDHDLDAEGHGLVAPLLDQHWRTHEVRFPSFSRRLSGGYASIGSARFDAVLRAALGGGLSCGADVAEVAPGTVVLAGGREVPADLVVDARGWGETLPRLPLAFQVFLGRDLALARDHGLRRPVLMDATVEQEGGFRFMYALPWTDRTVLVEDTCYGAPVLDRERSRARIARWAERHHLAVRRVTREEEGVLPLPMGGSFEDAWPPPADGVPFGVRAGLFHATTGYSLPAAVRAAQSLAALPVLAPRAVRAHVEALARASWRRQAFFRLLNRLLIRAAEPAQRYRVLERFYALPEPLIARFYAGVPTLPDKVRVLLGRPPVSLLRAARALATAPAEHVEATA